MDLSVFAKAFKEVLGCDLETPEQYEHPEWITDPAKIEAMINLWKKMTLNSHYGALSPYTIKHRNCGKSQFQNIQIGRFIDNEFLPVDKND